MTRRGSVTGLFALAAALLSAAPAAAAAVLVMLRQAPAHFRAGSDYAGGYGDALTRSAVTKVAHGIAARRGLTLVASWPMPLLGVDCLVMAVPAGQTAQAALAALAREPDVAWSEPVEDYVAQSAPPRRADPLFPAQPAAARWHLADLQQVATGRGIKVAVIDSRIETAHPDLAGRVAVTADFVGDGTAAAEEHGTAVAGIIAANAGNGVGIAGVAPQARLLALRACRQGAAGTPTLCDSLSIAKALHFAIERRAQVVNLSFGGPPGRLLATLIGVARARDIAVVAAFDRQRPDGGFPASLAGVIGVSDELLPPAFGGVYTAPGRGVPTARTGGRWTIVDGSSFAAAHVSGLLALLLERGATLPVALAALRLPDGTIEVCRVRRIGPAGTSARCAGDGDDARRDER